MCTVTIYRAKDGIVLSMSRDESRERAEGNVKSLCLDKGIKVIYPTDARAGGTWCGFNNQGVAMALLNRYQDTNQYLKHPSLAQTRGNIIPLSLSKGNYKNVVSHVKSLPMSAYNPFDLVVVSSSDASLYSWNGESLEIKDVFTNAILNDAEHWMITSSSVKTQEILSYRHSLFTQEKFQLSHQSVEDTFGYMPVFHLQRTDDASSSVFMDRELSHTKSFMQIVLHINEVKDKAYYVNDKTLLDRDVIELNAKLNFKTAGTLLNF